MRNFLRRAFLSLSLIVTGMLIFQTIKEYKYPSPNDLECKVYQAVYSDVVSKHRERNFLRPLTLKSEYEPLGGGPATFGKPTGVFEERYGIQVEVYAEFVHNVASYEPYTESSSLNLRNCFKSVDEKPTFWSNDISIYNTVQPEDHFDVAVFDVTSWNMFHIYFSPTEEFAVLYVQSYCGSLCAHGGLYLMKKEKDGWRIEGAKTLWIS